MNQPPPFNNAPTATITAPATGSTFDQGTSVAFTGTGHDQEDGDLPGNSLTWTSDRDGVIGHGTSFSTSALSVGTHTITLTATDSQDATATATVVIRVGYTQVVDAAGGDVCAVACHVMMYVPAGTVSGSTTFSVYPTFTPPADAHMVAGSAHGIAPTGVTFAQPIALGILYDPAHLPAGVSESSLRLCQLVEGSWQQVPGSGVNTSTHTVFANVTTLGTFAIIGTP